LTAGFFCIDYPKQNKFTAVITLNKILYSVKFDQIVNYETAVYLLNTFATLLTDNNLYNKLVSVITHLYTTQVHITVNTCSILCVNNK